MCFACAAQRVSACADPTNVATLVYCVDCGDIVAPACSNFQDKAWLDLARDGANWGYITGDGDSSCQTTVTFVAAFDNIPDVVAGCLGATNAVPANRGDARAAPNLKADAQVIKTNQCTIVITDVTGANIAINTRALYTFRARPAGSD
jgi:hypothetical protein